MLPGPITDINELSMGTKYFHSFFAEDGREEIQFNHVVEEEYILRICPCGSSSWQNSRDSRHHKYCECKNELLGRPHCSPVFHIEQGKTLPANDQQSQVTHR